MTREELAGTIRVKQSFLCVGLDADPSRIPGSLSSSPDPVLEFNRRIIEATAPACVAYKINTAFYEAMGAKGWETLEKTVRCIPPGILRIADAKRGDIENTSRMYAKAFFETLDFDAITVSPYMGKDSLLPFLEYKGKWTIVLACTSNPGHKDFQLIKIKKAGYRESLYRVVVKTARKWGSPSNMMFVAGAVAPEYIRDIREVAPDHFLLVPGVGAQGGSLKEVAAAGMTKDCGLLVNMSRSILYAGDGKDFAERAAGEASRARAEMKKLLAAGPAG